MADIIYNYPAMRAAASQIRELANRYKSAADVFEGDFTTAVSDWEGFVKEAVLKYITGPVDGYIADPVPKIINALADILEANADQMEAADKQISG
ncbi:MAG: hypothetical protein IJ170_10830 [Ruminococcus sp.]|nr:hypothetical protein [Ruminococcus sp.]